MSVVCYKCNKLGHFGACCRSKNVSMNEIDQLTHSPAQAPIGAQE